MVALVAATAVTAAEAAALAVAAALDAEAIAAAAAAANSQQQPLPEGTITREKRCETAQTNLKTISEKKNIFEEDSSGNLIPLSSEEIEKRRQQAQNDAEHFCGPASPAAQ